MRKSVPDMDARIMLNHWSGNIAGWGGAAPAQDMFMYVDWMAYSSEYPSATAIAPPAAKRNGHTAPRSAVLAYDGNRMQVLVAGSENPSSPSGYFTVQGKPAMTSASLRP
jgi:hypothetical protein